MDQTLEKQELFKTSQVAAVAVGDHLVNLGEVIEINEKDDIYSFVIYRMNQLQVWTFAKEDLLFIL